MKRVQNGRLSTSSLKLLLEIMWMWCSSKMRFLKRVLLLLLNPTLCKKCSATDIVDLILKTPTTCEPMNTTLTRIYNVYSRTWCILECHFKRILSLVTSPSKSSSHHLLLLPIRVVMSLLALIWTIHVALPTLIHLMSSIGFLNYLSRKSWVILILLHSESIHPTKLLTQYWCSNLSCLRLFLI